MRGQFPPRSLSSTTSLTIVAARHTPLYDAGQLGRPARNEPASCRPDVDAVVPHQRAERASAASTRQQRQR